MDNPACVDLLKKTVKEDRLRRSLELRLGYKLEQQIHMRNPPYSERQITELNRDIEELERKLND